MIFEFCFLSPFEGEELTKGEKVAVIFGASIDFDAAGNSIVSNIDHCAFANRAGGACTNGEGVFGSDGIKIHGGGFADEVSD